MNGTHQCDFYNFCGTFGPQRVLGRVYESVSSSPLQCVGNPTGCCQTSVSVGLRDWVGKKIGVLLGGDTEDGSRLGRSVHGTRRPAALYEGPPREHPCHISHEGTCNDEPFCIIVVANLCSAAPVCTSKWPRSDFVPPYAFQMLPRRLCCNRQSAMPAQRMRGPKQVEEPTSPIFEHHKFGLCVFLQS